RPRGRHGGHAGRDARALCARAHGQRTEGRDRHARRDASLLTYQAGLYWNAGGRPTRRGNQHPSIVPHEVFQAQDAYLTLGVANNSLWERACRAIGREDLTRDPRFDTEANRVTNRAALVPILNETFSARPAADWLARLEEHGVPAGRIKTVAEVCESPHLKARGMPVSLPPP